MSAGSEVATPHASEKSQGRSNSHDGALTPFI